MGVISNSLIGFVVGDAIGVSIEFEDREKLMKSPVTSMQGFGSYDVPEGVWSDDTAMTLATMDSIIKCNDIDCNDIADRFCNWLNNAEYTATNEVFDIGITTKYALMRYWEDKSDATKCGGTSIIENGNGSLMRMLPIALYCYYKKIKQEEIFNIIKNVSSITHAHEISIMGCYIYVRYILYILNEKDKLASYNMIKSIDYSVYFSKETIEQYNRLLNLNIRELKIDDIDSTGYVVSTLESVLWIILNCDSYSQSIIGAINLGGDTDTIGAITGSIAGIIYGYNSIPKKWLEKMKRLDYLENMSETFENILEGNRIGE